MTTGQEWNVKLLEDVFAYQQLGSFLYTFSFFPSNEKTLFQSNSYNSFGIYLIILSYGIFFFLFLVKYCIYLIEHHIDRWGDFNLSHFPNDFIK